MKKFLCAAVLFAALAAPAHAAYLWERYRTAYNADGSVRIADPSSPASIAAHNYRQVTGLRCPRVCPADTAGADVLSVAHAMPADSVLQASTPVRMPAMAVQAVTLDSPLPVMVAPRTVQASGTLKPAGARHAYQLVPVGSHAAPSGAPETYDNTAVSPGYGYADDVQDPDTLMPLP